jgi:MerR family redox-sensitive transcriptional activator SoxR
MSELTLTIGQVAEMTGLNRSALRFYEAQGLLPEPEREKGQRRYTEDTLRRLAVIDTAKQAGFSLDEVAVLLRSADDGSMHEQLRALAERRLPDVEALIGRAEAMRRWLTVASGCGCSTLDECALFREDGENSNECTPPMSLTRVSASTRA